MEAMQRQAQRRHRTTIIGSVVGVLAVVGLVIGLFVGLSGSNNPPTGKKASALGSTSQSPTPTSSLSPSPSPSAGIVAAATKTCKPIKPNPPAKGEPKARNVSKAPTKLQIIDLKSGHGAPVKSGDKATVKYVGIGCSSGKVFDASYTDGAPHKEFTFTVGKGEVIPGWDQGVPGMRPGGVRELVIPSNLAYGASGSPTKIGPNAPLIFLVTLDKVSS
jgi:peptidylprolyl isomerase